MDRAQNISRIRMVFRIVMAFVVIIRMWAENVAPNDERAFRPSRFSLVFELRTLRSSHLREIYLLCFSIRIAYFHNPIYDPCQVVGRYPIR